jgi:type I restriction enzyme S subunit
MTLQPTDEVQLSEVIEIKHGFAFQSEFFGRSGDFLLLTPGNFAEAGGFRDLGKTQKEYSGPVPRNFILNEGDVLVAMTEQSPGLLGATIKVPKSNTYLHNQRLGLITIRRPDRITKGYAYHLFNAPHLRKEIAAAASGTKVKHTSPAKLCSLKASLPPLRAQELAASMLDTWDAAIEKTERLIAVKAHRNEVLSNQLLFGKVRLGQRDTRTTKALHWFSMPSDWHIVEIGQIASEVSVNNSSDDDLPVLSCTKYDGLVDSLKYFDKQVFSHDTSKYKIVRRGQFAYATNHIEEGSIGYQDFVPAGLVSPIYTVFQADARKIDDGYLYKLLKTEKLRQLFAANTNASVDQRGSLRWKEFARIHIPLPPLAEQQQISTILNVAKREVALLQSQAEALKTQKRGLMQKLLTGQWRIFSKEGEPFHE